MWLKSHGAIRCKDVVTFFDRRSRGVVAAPAHGIPYITYIQIAPTVSFTYFSH